jgi:SAM-dependent methyltransferase
VAIPRRWIERWRHVDQQPETYIGYLDASRGSDRRQADADPAGFHASLELAPGHHVLDVGCAMGETLRRLAPLVGPSGRLVGVDASTAMIAEAAARGAGTVPPIEAFVADAARLPFEGAMFDRVLASSLLQHLDEPEPAIAEMARVVRPGGRVIVAEHDWDTLVIEADPPELARRMCQTFRDALPSGTIGRRAAELFARHGLTDVTVRPLTYVIRGFEEGDAIDRAFAIELAVEAAVPAGIIGPREADAWRSQLLERARDGRFFLSFTAFETSGTRR